MAVRELLTPKQVARAIGVSESSLKRWCDQGLLPSVRTVGGHRRIPISGVMQYLRSSGQQLVAPEVLGLPRLSTHPGEDCLRRCVKRLVEAIVDRDEARVRQIVFELDLSGEPISRIGDQLIVPAFDEIGRRWSCGGLEVYEERCACEMVLRTLHEFRMTLPPAAESAPQALGGAIESDHYALPTTLIELVLLQSGWRATSLGSNLPFSTMQAAIEQVRPQLFWLSVSSLTDESRFLASYPELYHAARDAGTALVVGGRALTPELRQQVDFTFYGDGLQRLADFVTSLPAALKRVRCRGE